MEEVNTELLFQTEAPFLTIIGKNGETAEINMADASYSVDYTKALQGCIKNQHSLLWPLAMMKENHMILEPESSWDEEKIKLLLFDLQMVQDRLPQDTRVRISLGENGYELEDHTKGVFQPEYFAAHVLQNLRMGMYKVELDDSDVFCRDLEYTQEQQDILQQWEKLKGFLECGIVYDMGDTQLALDKGITSTFVLTDERGNILLDELGRVVLREEGIEEFIEKLASEYNTCDTELSFEATRGETVQVPYKNYGTELDTETEIEYLKTAFMQKIEEVHVPAYTQEAYVRGKNDIGDTYIEIDMTSQKLYGYKEGELLIETDIVTGNMRRGWDTPVGVNHVYSKQKNRILRGATYASHVDYWMPVNGNIGIHDADWRKKFGGEIYLKNGSHGCINIPPKVMPTIYEEYEVGTPVIMFY